MVEFPPNIINKLIIMKLSLEPTPSAKCIHWHCEKYERTVEAFVLDIYIILSLPYGIKKPILVGIVGYCGQNNEK